MQNGTQATGIPPLTNSAPGLPFTAIPEPTTPEGGDPTEVSGSTLQKAAELPKTQPRGGFSPKGCTPLRTSGALSQNAAKFAGTP